MTDKKRLEDLRQLAEKAGAVGNYFDAVNDLLRWPHLYNEILDDLERAIVAHTTEGR